MVAEEYEISNLAEGISLNNDHENPTSKKAESMGLNPASSDLNGKLGGKPVTIEVQDTDLKDKLPQSARVESPTNTA